MNSDVILVSGLVLGVFAVPAIISALSDRRPPRTAAVALLVAGCLVIWAIQTNPAGYSLRDVPYAVVRVVGKVIN